MSHRLITVATFQDPVAAALARNFLESEGISACLVDESTVATDWLISNAIGGIKLQVEPMQVERAEMLLTQSRAEDDEEDAPTPQTAIAAQDAAEELRQEDEDRAPINVMADRIYRSAVFGLLLLPLQLYVLYLLVRIRQEEGHVSANRRWKIAVAVVLNIPLMAMIAIPLLWVLDVWSATPGTPESPVWQRRLIARGGFSIRFPHEPRFNEGKAIGRFGAVRLQSWTAWSPRRTYGVTIDRNVKFPANLTPEQVLQMGAHDRLLDGVGVMREEAAIDFQGVPGREFWIAFAETDERGRVFMRGDDLIFIYTLGSPQDVKSEEAEQFLKSFRFR